MAYGFYVVSNKSGLTVTDSNSRWQGYKTMAAAKAARTRVCEKFGFAWADLTIVRAEGLREFRESRQLPTQVERTNLMTGQKFMEDVDTPYFCSPASESFWSN